MYQSWLYRVNRDIVEAVFGISSRSEPTGHAAWKVVGSRTEILQPVGVRRGMFAGFERLLGGYH